MKKALANHSLTTVILLSNAVSFLLFIFRIMATGSITYWFMFWNLMLAWVPLAFAFLLIRRLRKHLWAEPVSVALSVGWLLFLPNSFYLISDLIHLQQASEVGVLFDSVLLMSFIWNGLLAGFLSLFVVHKALYERRGRVSHLLIAGVLLLNSFAIYLGRSLRWNSWDVFTNPGGLLFDVSERVINPFAYPQLFVTTSTFFLLLASIYAVVWHLHLNSSKN